MDDMPPPEAFEPHHEADARGRVRRWGFVTVTLVVLAALVVLAVVGSGGIVIRSDVVAEPTLEPGRLAVVDGAGAITIVNEDGGSIASYPVPGVRFTFPAWAPDGTHLAAIGQGPTGTGVYVFPTPTGGPTTSDPVIAYASPDHPPFYLYWTPDGEQVAFLTTEPDGLALRLAPGDGSHAATVVRRGAPMYWTFVDPSRLVVHSGAGGPDAFFGEVAVDGAPVAGTDRATGIFRSPTVSADGRYLGYLAAGDEPVGEVVREARDGSGTTRIRVFGPAAMSFAPPGGVLAFVAPDEPTSNPLPLPVGPLRLLEPEASTARTVVAGSVIAFFWSPTGKTIAVLRLDNNDDNVTQAEAGEPVAGEPVADGPMARTVAVREAVAGLSLRLSFVGAFDGLVGSERNVRVSDLFVNQVLPFFDQYALSHRFWSPDGRALVLPIVGPGDVTQLFSIPADGSEPRVLATAEFGSWSP